jgi:hypothetical protein
MLHGAKGDLQLTNLTWISYTAGWGQARINRTCEDKPLMVNDKTVEGIGTHSESMIIYQLPEGYDTFSATAFLTEKGSVVFGILVDKIAYDFPDKSDIKVDFAAIGLKGKVQVHDLWSHEDLGTFDGNFTRELPQHGAGLYRLTPLK